MILKQKKIFLYFLEIIPVDKRGATSDFIVMFYATLPVETLAMDVCTHCNNANIFLCSSRPFRVYVFSRLLCVFPVYVCTFLSPSLHVFSPGLYIPTLLLSSGPVGELSNFRVFCLE